MANMINLTINGKNVSVEKGTTIIEAAKKIGIDIPNLCYEKALLLLPVAECVLLK